MNTTRIMDGPALRAQTAGRPKPRRSLGWYVRRTLLWAPDVIFWKPRHWLQCRTLRKMGTLGSSILASDGPTMPYRVAFQTNRVLLNVIRELAARGLGGEPPLIEVRA